MTQNTYNKAGDVPRLALINSFAGFGRCSTTISLPVISVMKVQVCPVPTSILSNHLAFPHCYFDDYSSRMRDYIHAWEQLQVTFDGLYCGFLGSVEQIAVVKEFINGPLMQTTHMNTSASKPLFLLDPVMGDNGRLYSTITDEHCRHMKKLAAMADILTPNITEACILTDTPYKEKRWTDHELSEICCKLTQSNQKCGTERSPRIVITGLREDNKFVNYIWENNHATIYYANAVGGSRHGTGDLFASILAADAMNQVPFEISVKKAADFVATCIKGSEEAGTPSIEGVIFEKYLGTLAHL